MQNKSQNLFSFRELFGKTREVSFVREAWGSVRNAIWGSSAAMIVAVTILFLSLLTISKPARVYPFEETKTVATQSAVKIEYYLPYPGILPDSPLYLFKAARDRVWLWLTWDSEKKAQAELLLADKRIGAAKALIEGGKANLGVGVATKGEKYLEQAVKRTVSLNKQKDTKSLLLKLRDAVNGHGQLLTELQEKVPVDDRDEIGMARQVNRMAAEEVNQGLMETE